MTRAWPSYLAVATIGYLIYGLGAAVPYIRAHLGLSETELGLHSTALAIGLFVAGIIVAPVGRRIGEVRVRAAALGILAIAVVALVLTPSLPITLGAALGVGIGTGVLLGYANAALAAPGGTRARLQVARANVWAMVAAFVCPLVLSFGATRGPGWWLGLLPGLLLVGALVIDLRGGPRVALPPSGPIDVDRLPRDFWIAWTFVVAAVATEFAIVFWASTLVERRTSVATSNASVIGALFLAGMFAGRLLLSAGLGSGQDVRRPATIGFALAAVGIGGAWLSTVPVLTGAALFLAGLGVAALYPIGVAAGLAASAGRLAHAGARINVASALAIVSAPLALGVVADRAGVVTGWGFILALVALGLLVAFRLPREEAAAEIVSRA